MNKNAFKLSTLTEDIGKRCQVQKVIVEDLGIAVPDTYQAADNNIVDQEALRKILTKISICPNLDSLLAIEAEMNNIGLTFYTLPGGKAILCKIINGTPSASSAMDDYIVLGPVTNKNFEISDRMVACIQAFINLAASGPTRIVTKHSAFHSNPVLYGQPPVVNNG